jgi:hypothetical protein
MDGVLHPNPAGFLVLVGPFSAAVCAQRMPGFCLPFLFSPFHFPFYLLPEPAPMGPGVLYHHPTVLGEV